MATAHVYYEGPDDRDVRGAWPGGRSGRHGRRDQPRARRGDGPRRARARLRRGRRRGQGRRLYGHARARREVRRPALLQQPARRALGHRLGRRPLGRGLHARRRDPVRRLRVARHAAAPQPGRLDALPLQRRVGVPDGDPDALRRLHPRRPVPQPERRGDVRALARPARRDALNGGRRQGPAQERHPRPRPGRSSWSTSRSTGRARPAVRSRTPTSSCPSARRASLARART